MFSHTRQRAILDLLARRERLSVRDLQCAVRASPATIRRDLRELQERGQVIRVHGGVIRPDYLDSEPSWDMRRSAAVAAKECIGARAAALVADGQTVFLDAGTTCLEVGRHLLRRERLTLYTISVPLLELARHGRARVVCVGGEYRRPTRALVGSLTLAWLDNLRFDVAFLGAAGLAARGGASTTELREAAIKQDLLERAALRVLVADSSKWNYPVAIRYAAWKCFDAWVCDARLPVAARRCVAGHEVRVVLARPEQDTQRRRSAL